MSPSLIRLNSCLDTEKILQLIESDYTIGLISAMGETQPAVWRGRMAQLAV